MAPVWKQRLDVAPETIRARRVLSVGVDAEEQPACWFEAGEDAWVVWLTPTGAEAPPAPGATFLGTFAIPHQGLVLHGWARRA